MGWHSQIGLIHWMEIYVSWKDYKKGVIKVQGNFKRQGSTLKLSAGTWPAPGSKWRVEREVLELQGENHIFWRKQCHLSRDRTILKQLPLLSFIWRGTQMANSIASHRASKHVAVALIGWIPIVSMEKEGVWIWRMNGRYKVW